MSSSDLYRRYPPQEVRMFLKPNDPTGWSEYVQSLQGYYTIERVVPIQRYSSLNEKHNVPDITVDFKSAFSDSNIFLDTSSTFVKGPQTRLETMIGDCRGSPTFVVVSPQDNKSALVVSRVLDPSLKHLGEDLYRIRRQELHLSPQDRVCIETSRSNWEYTPMDAENVNDPISLPMLTEETAEQLDLNHMGQLFLAPIHSQPGSASVSGQGALRNDVWLSEVTKFFNLEGPEPSLLVDARLTRYVPVDEEPSSESTTEPRVDD